MCRAPKGKSLSVLVFRRRFRPSAKRRSCLNADYADNEEPKSRPGPANGPGPSRPRPSSPSAVFQRGAGPPWLQEDPRNNTSVSALPRPDSQRANHVFVRPRQVATLNPSFPVSPRDSEFPSTQEESMPHMVVNPAATGSRLVRSGGRRRFSRSRRDVPSAPRPVQQRAASAQPGELA